MTAAMPELHLYVTFEDLPIERTGKAASSPRVSIDKAARRHNHQA
jgi:hypothetical protein